MTKFEFNNPTRLKEFLKQLNELVDEFHPNIYLMDDVSDESSKELEKRKYYIANYKITLKGLLIDEDEFEYYAMKSINKGTVKQEKFIKSTMEERQILLETDH